MASLALGPLQCVGPRHSKSLDSLSNYYTRDTYTQCRASRSELVRLKVLVCEHDCCNRSMHGTVLGSLDGGRLTAQ